MVARVFTKMQLRALTCSPTICASQFPTGHRPPPNCGPGVGRIVPFPGSGDFTHRRSHLNYLPCGLLQHTLPKLHEQT